MDRNKANLVKPAWADNVALHPEGVDRNEYMLNEIGVAAGSPSTRRAWIEIRHSIWVK